MSFANSILFTSIMIYSSNGTRNTRLLALRTLLLASFICHGFIDALALAPASTSLARWQAATGLGCAEIGPQACDVAGAEDKDTSTFYPNMVIPGIICFRRDNLVAELGCLVEEIVA